MTHYDTLVYALRHAADTLLLEHLASAGELVEVYEKLKAAAPLAASEERLLAYAGRIALALTCDASAQVSLQAALSSVSSSGVSH